MDQTSIYFMIAIFAIICCIFFYGIGYNHGSRYLALHLLYFKENSRYEVLSFFAHLNGVDHIMLLKNLDADCEYPIAAVSGPMFAQIWRIGEILKTDANKELSLAA